MRIRSTLFAAGALALAALCWPAAGWADCGPGPLITMNKKGIVLQSLGMTTNATWLPLGAASITTGTSGCTNSGLIRAEYEAEFFLATAGQNVEQDVAQGGGPYVAAVAELMGCPPERQGDFARLAQSRFAALPAGAERQPARWLAQLRAELATEPALAAACTGGA
jgi:hypothetical protein